MMKLQFACIGVLLAASLGGCVALQAQQATLPAPTVPNSQSRAQSPRVVFDRLYGKGNPWYRFESLALGVGGDLWMTAIADSTDDSISAISNRAPTSADLSNDLWIWRVRSGGDVTASRKLHKPETNQAGHTIDSSLSENLRLCRLQPHKILLVANLTEGLAWVIGLDSAARAEFTKELLPAAPGFFVLKCVRTTDGHCLVLGRAATTYFIVKMDSTGSVLWSEERSGPKTSTSFDVDVVAEDRGGYLIVQNVRLAANQAHGNLANCWIGRFDSSGTLQTGFRMPFSGRLLWPVRSPDGTYFFVHEKIDRTGENLSLVALDSAMSLLWSTPISTTHRDQTRLRIAAMANGGGCVVAGTRDHKLFLGRYDNTGKQQWEFFPGEAFTATQYDVAVSDDDDIFVASTVYVAVAGVMRSRVRLVKIVEQ